MNDEQAQERFRVVFMLTVAESHGKSIEQLEQDLIETHTKLFDLKARVQAIERYKEELIKEGKS